MCDTCTASFLLKTLVVTELNRLYVFVSVGPEKWGARGVNGELFVRFFACQLTGVCDRCVEDLVLNACRIVEL